MWQKIRLPVILGGLLLLISRPLLANAIMTSTNYYIYADTVDTGGSVATSATYSLQDTIGETTSDVATSSSYTIRGGYQGMELGTISLQLSSATVNLGTLVSGQVSSASSIATVSTDSLTGYTLSVSSVSGTSITSVSDGSVSANSEEYGLAVSGDDRFFSDDRGISPGLVLAASSTAVSASATTLTFKASMSSGSSAGSYSQTVVLGASANL